MTNNGQKIHPFYLSIISLALYLASITAFFFFVVMFNFFWIAVTGFLALLAIIFSSTAIVGGVKIKKMSGENPDEKRKCNKAIVIGAFVEFLTIVSTILVIILLQMVAKGMGVVKF